MKKNYLIFSKKDLFIFLSTLVLLSTGFLAMANDPVQNGFGWLTLWFAPIVLLIGFFLPVIGILGFQNIRKKFRKNFASNSIKQNYWKIGGGIFVFLSSLFIYILTLEQTASLWDCAEFIACAYKLQVPHTPGNPLFLLFGRIFTLFSFGDVSMVAWWMNFMSAVFSSLAVLFVFLIILELSGKIRNKLKMPEWSVIFGAMSGSLAMAFIDSFWFSAVEAETYAAGSFFLVFNVWLGLVYLKIQDTEMKRRWIVLTTYIVCLSYCVHPMALLAIPVIAVSWYFEKRELNFKNISLSVILGLVVLLFINRFVAVGLFELAFQLDLLLVNSLHFPFYSGAWLTIILILGIAFFLIRRKPKFNVFTWSLLFVILGFTPYLMLLIRSNFNPPIDETNPEDLVSIKAYMNRESYGTRPLIYGPYFDTEITGYSSGKKAYYQDEDHYEIAGNRVEYQYDAKHETLLPRMYSRDADHIAQYKAWARLRENEKPTFIDNIYYLFRYQLGHMYFRYLMWNFSGRVSDVQHDDWLRPWEKASSEFSSKARNQYWMIPFLIGLAGMFFQSRHDRKGFLTTLVFFLITGIVLALYLNSPPQEPRERDYIYVGSFMAFCIWVGVGVLFILQFLNEKVQSKGIQKVIGVVITLGLPSLLLFKNFDDHDRSGRTIQMDSARNLLETCEPNAILFTGGDNDTFPLWYLQEVEGIRTDVRIIVLSYFNTDWYIGQLKNTYYESEAFNLTLDREDYRQYGLNDVIYYRENPKVKGAIDVRNYINLLHDQHPALVAQTQDGDPISLIPSKELVLKIDQAKIVQNVSLPSYLSDGIQESIVLKMKNNYLEKNALVFLDLLISNHWERPVYFNYTSMNSIGLDVKPYLVQEGQVFRFLPIKNNSQEPMLNREKMFDHLVNSSDFDNLKNDNIYLNHEDYVSRIVVPVSQYFYTLAVSYLNNGDREYAQKIMDKSLELFHSPHLPPTYANLQTVQLLSALDMNEEAVKIGEETIEYYSSALEEENKNGQSSDLNEYVLQNMSSLVANLKK